MHTQVEFVTPAQAKEFLKKQRHNRSISSQLVNKYQATMRAGNWLTTHQGIAFDSQDRLCDGAHRMIALSRLLGKIDGIHIQVTRGLPSDVVEVVDSGRSRSVSDRLAIRRDGLSYANTRVAVANTLLSGRGQKTDQQIGDVVFHASVFDGFNAMAKVGGALQKLRSSILAALVYAHPIAPEVVVAMARALVDGDELKKGTPAYAARRLLVERTSTKARRRGIMELRDENMRRMLTAIEAQIKGQTMSIPRVSAGSIKFVNDRRQELGLPLYIQD